MKETKKITIDLADLDHILDVDYLKENKDTSPSRLFIDGLKREMKLNGLDWNREIYSIEIRR